MRSPPRSPEQSLFSFDVATGQTRELINVGSLDQGKSAALSPEESARLERQRVGGRGITSFQLSEDGEKVAVVVARALYVIGRRDGRQLLRLAQAEAPLDPKFSPNGRMISYVRGHDVFVADLASGKERQVTRGGTATLTHGLAEFVAQEETHRSSGYWWSPDSKWIAYEEADISPVEHLQLADPSRPEKSPQTFFYPRAGRANAKVRLGVISASGGPTVWVQWDVGAYPYLANVVWSEGGPLSLLVQNRRQTEEVLLAANPKSGHTTPLVKETDSAWLNLAPGLPAWLKDGSGFFWFTERNGGPEVELRSPQGQLRATWIKPDAGLQHWVGFDPKNRWAYFTGSPDPTQSLLYRVREGGVPEQVKTNESLPASQTAYMARDGSALAVSTADDRSLRKTMVVRSDGSISGPLPSVALEPPPTSTSVEIRKIGGGDGFWSSIVRPKGFQKGARYPVILLVYGGPTVIFVKHAYVPLDHWFAEQGFFVIRIDGRGTPGRGHDWERAGHGDFSRVTVDDQVSGLRTLAQEVPEIDLKRVGIVGWSFGGYLSALALLKRPDVFKAAVAGAPVVDWKDYDTFYTERYLGLPEENRGGYEASSLLTYASKLERPLLIIHGTADDNVFFLHSLKLSDALFKAGKPHGLLPLNGPTHMVREPLLIQRLWERVILHFRQNL